MSVKFEWKDRAILADIKNALSEESLSIAKQVATQAKAFCPKDTGALADSITAKESQYKNGGAIIEVGKGDQYYASFIELGRKKAPAYPFLRPALEVIKPIAKARIERKIKRALK